MKSKLLLSLVLFLVFGCSKEKEPFIPVEITITSQCGAVEIRYGSNKIDTLTKAQGSMTINVMNNDLVRVKRICPAPEPLEYNIKTPFFSQLTVLLKNGDENYHLIHY